LNWEELPDEVPPSVRSAIKLLIGQLYKYREVSIDGFINVHEIPK